MGHLMVLLGVCKVDALSISDGEKKKSPVNHSRLICRLAHLPFSLGKKKTALLIYLCIPTILKYKDLM